MAQQDIRARARYIRETYPDCPQRQMALDLLRRGRIEQSDAWIDALDQLIADGNAALLESGQRLKASRSA